MNSTLEEMFQFKISRLKGMDFQTFMEKLYLTCYGNNFTKVLQKRDKGCDGILSGKTVIAVYAPEMHSLDAFKRKIKNETRGNEGDFDKYMKHWQTDYPGWQVVYNGEFTAEMVQFIKSLKKDTELLGRQHLLTLIQGQPWGRIRDVAGFLGIEEQFFIREIFEEIIQDLLKDCSYKNPKRDYSPPVYIKEKISLNFSGEDIETIGDDYKDALKYFHTLQMIMKEYGDTELDALKNNVREDIKKYNGNFKEKFQLLMEQYYGKNKNDALYKLYVKVLMIYLFEQCLLGGKTRSEQ